jgi:hypothetical protein
VFSAEVATERRLFPQQERRPEALPIVFCVQRGGATGTSYIKKEIPPAQGYKTPRIAKQARYSSSGVIYGFHYGLLYCALFAINIS